MTAHIVRAGLLLATVTSLGASHRTPNFTIHAPTDEMAQAIGTAAEQYRRELAQEWFGETLPDWRWPCPIVVDPGEMPAQGSTSFSLIGGEFSRWKIVVRGPYDDILSSVLPHEVSHAVFAARFRQPLPRWADEGAAMLSEDESERKRHRQMVRQRLDEAHPIRLRSLLSMREYPAAGRKMMDLYIVGHSLTSYLVAIGSKADYIRFLELGTRSGWDRAVQQVYGFENVEALEKRWKGWVRRGSPSAPEIPDQRWVSRPSATGPTAAPRQWQAGSLPIPMSP